MDTMVQMNTRISKQLKSDGDAALALIGLSPSQAVRALWEKAARRGEELEQIRAFLKEEGRDESDTVSKKQKSMQEFWKYMDAMYAKLDIDPSLVQDYSEDELLEEYWQERMEGRGLS